MTYTIFFKRLQQLCAHETQNKQNKDDNRLRAARSLLRGLLERLWRFDDALATGDRDGITHATTRLLRAARTFRSEPFVDIQNAFPIWSRTSFREGLVRTKDAIDDLLRYLTNITPDSKAVPEARDALITLTHAIEYAQVRQRQVKGVRQSIFSAVTLISLSAGMLAAFYLGLKDGLGPVGTEVLLPSPPHRERSVGEFTSAPQDLLAYFDRFSAYYFGQATAFPDYFYPKPDVEKYTHTTIKENEATMQQPPSANGKGGTSQVSSVRRMVPDDISSRPNDNIDNTHRQLWRVILENKSPYRSNFIGTIRADLCLAQLRAFPWGLLRCTPNVLANGLSSTDISLVDVGRGPALDVKWQLRTLSRVALSRGDTWIIFDKNWTVPYLDPAYLFPVGPINSWPIKQIGNTPASYPVPPSPEQQGQPNAEKPVNEPNNARDAKEGQNHSSGSSGSPRKLAAGQGNHADVADDAVLDRPLFLCLADSPPSSREGDRFFEYANKWYEVISTLERLRAITRVEYRTPAVLSIEYASVTGKRYERHFVHDLPASVVFYERVDNLLERDPRETYTKDISYTVSRMVPEQRVKLAEALALPEIQPKGVDLLIKALEFDFETDVLALGGRKSKTIEVNEFLNPSGRIVLYLVVVEPMNARYDADVYVNGEISHQFRVNVLAPPSLHFPTDDDQRRAESSRITEAIHGSRIRSLEEKMTKKSTAAQRSNE